jgi:hypothetical protein
MNPIYAALIALTLSLRLAAALPSALAQAPSDARPSGCTGAPLSGTVRDNTLAVIPGVTLTLDGSSMIESGPDGRFRFPCVATGSHELTAKAAGFAPLTMKLTAPHERDLDLHLSAGAEVSVTVESEDEAAVAVESVPSAVNGTTIKGNQLQSLADDPDDLLKELQQMAAASGGNPSAATVAIDGFDNGEGTAHLPPKSSIAYIKVNPDLFSAEYRNPPFGGGRIEIYTKPGQSTFHGALFATNSSSWMNAKDPFSVTSSSLGKQRYGFEFTGPIRKQGSDFFTSLEHRDIANDAVVNAIGVNAAGVQTPILQTIPAPQHLWVGNAKVDWQLGSKNTLIASIDSFNNNQINQGIGGVFLADNGYTIYRYDYNVHVTDVTVISPKIMHEFRFGLESDGFADTPGSTAPQVSVAGAFTSGGGSAGNSHEHEIWLSPIDDVIIQTKKHLPKIGVQPEYIHINAFLRTTFNGVYNFGGGTTATGQTLTGIQQYVNALNGAPNGAPTSFNNTTGNPEVDVTQIRNATYVQDDWKIVPNLNFSYGLRHYTQNHPTFGSEFQPRFGLAWSPDKKATWSLHAHAGMFAGRLGGHNWQSIQFANGINRSQNLVYSPACAGTFNPATCQPLTTAPVIHTVRSVQPGLKVTYWASENLGFTKTFPKGWAISADYMIAQMWNYTRSENINSPTNGSPTGPRPLGANINNLQMQGTGRGYGNVTFFSVSNQALKRIQFFTGAVRVNIIDNTDDNPLYAPQTTGVNTGEYARRDNQGLWQVFGNASLNLPSKLVLSANYHGNGDNPFNVTTGFDNNGDGDFNDRPRYASAGTPLCSTSPNASPCAYNTPWGNLVNSGGVGSLPRNKGVMPWTFYLDTNLSRAFKLTHNDKATHPQTLSVNIRSSNVLNHLNVTSVGSVLGSPNFGRAYAGDNGRRIEAGVRYAF